jgi:hypothetical protein
MSGRDDVKQGPSATSALRGMREMNLGAEEGWAV